MRRILSHAFLQHYTFAFLLCCIGVCSVVPLNAQKRDTSDICYFGLQPDTATAIVLAPEFAHYTVRDFASQSGIIFRDAPWVSSDGLTLCFSTETLGGEGGADLWIGVKENPRQDDFTEVINAGVAVNSEFDETHGAISPDGTRLFFVSCDRDGGVGKCDLYEARLVEDHWGDVSNIEAVNSSEDELHPALRHSGDSLFLYYTSDNNGGFLAKPGDIYGMVNVQDQWEVAGWPHFYDARLCFPISSNGRETSPFMTADGKRFFFISDHYPGYGGTDIFVTELLEDGSWSLPKNLGPQFNSPNNEQMITGTPNGDILYVASLSDDNRTEVRMAVRSTTTVSPAHENASTDLSMTVYPNPAHDEIMLSFRDRSVADTEMLLYNERGELMVQETIRGRRQALPISVRGLPPGVYFVQVGEYRAQFVKEN